MKFDTISEFGSSYGLKERQISTASTASTTEPSSPQMSRMVSPESDSGEIGDVSVDFEIEKLPDGVYHAEIPKSNVVRPRSILLLVGGLFVYGLLTSVSCRLFAGVLAVLMLVPGLYICKVNGCSLDHSWPEDFEVKESNAVEEEEDDKLEKVQTSMLSFVSLGLGSICNACVYMSVFIGAVATLMPAALMMLPLLYLCLRDDCNNEVCDEKDNQREEGNQSSSISLVRWGLGHFLRICLYGSVFFFIGALSLLTIWMPTAVAFSLQD